MESKKFTNGSKNWPTLTIFTKDQQRFEIDDKFDYFFKEFPLIDILSLMLQYGQINIMCSTVNINDEPILDMNKKIIDAPGLKLDKKWLLNPSIKYLLTNKFNNFIDEIFFVVNIQIFALDMMSILKTNTKNYWQSILDKSIDETDIYQLNQYPVFIKTQITELQTTELNIKRHYRICVKSQIENFVNLVNQFALGNVASNVFITELEKYMFV